MCNEPIVFILLFIQFLIKHHFWIYRTDEISLHLIENPINN